MGMAHSKYTNVTRKSTAYKGRQTYRVKRSRRFNKMALTPSKQLFIQPSLKATTMPSTKLVTMRYADTFTLDSNSGLVSRFIRANSIYDPDYTGVGHQPMGRDEWMTFYNHYTVVSSKLKVWFYSEQITDNYCSPIGITVRDTSSTVSTTWQDMVEQGKSNWRLFKHDGNAGPHFPTLYNKFNAKQFFGITDIRDNRQDIGATTDNNPAEDAYFQIWHASTDGATNVSPLICLFVVDYLVYLSEPKELNSS